MLSFPNRLFTLAVALGTAIASWSLPSEALTREKQSIWKIPVFYVTDRQPEKTTFGPRRIFEDHTVARVESGIVDVCVEENAKKPMTDWQANAIRTEVSALEEPKLTKFKGESTTDLINQFDTTLTDAIKRSGKKEVFVFIHGFNNSFNVAAANAAQLGYYTGCPVVLYSWPSASKLYRYSVDECNNEWSQEHFNQFIEHLLQFKNAQGVHLNLVAHSMGNRLFVRAVPIFSGKGIFNDIYMVNPDFDAQTFIHYLSRFIPATGIVAGVHAQLLISRKDNALSAAEALFGGYTRLGQGVDSTLSALTNPQLFSSIWTHPSSDKHKLAEQKSDPNVIASIKKAFRIFDVTVLDHGVIGHKVPHEFIAWMHNRNQAPPGFEINMEKSKGANKIANFFARKLKEDIGNTAGEIGIVVKSTPVRDVAQSSSTPN